VKPGFDSGLPKAPVPTEANTWNPSGARLGPDPVGLHSEALDELMPKSLATATVERLLHHAHVLITDGQDSYRLAQATAGKGVNHSANTPQISQSVGGEIRGHQWGEKMATSGETRGRRWGELDGH
jgi:hypothetical protein